MSYSHTSFPSNTDVLQSNEVGSMCPETFPPDRNPGPDIGTDLFRVRFPGRIDSVGIWSGVAFLCLCFDCS